MTPLAKSLFQETQELHVIEAVAADILGASSALKTGELNIMCGAPNPAMALISEFRRRYPSGVRVPPILVTGIGSRRHFMSNNATRSS